MNTSYFRISKIQTVIILLCIILLFLILTQYRINTGYQEKHFIGKTTIGNKLKYKEIKSHTYTIKTKRYTVIIRDNDVPNYRGYNGIASLIIAGSKKNIFAPNASGMNFEWIGRYSKYMSMEPRASKMKIRKISENTVELYQPPTNLWRIESSMRFTASSEKTLDITFGLIPHRIAGKHIHFLFANYMNNPSNKNIYFVGHTPKNPQIRWIEVTQPEANHETIFWVKTLSPAVKSLTSHKKNGIYINQNWEEVKYLEWRYPVFYGAIDDTTIFICMVKDKRSFPHYHIDGGGKNNPAWDIDIVLPKMVNDVYIKFDIRIVVKKFISREDIISEYNNWLKTSIKKVEDS